MDIRNVRAWCGATSVLAGLVAAAAGGEGAFDRQAYERAIARQVEKMAAAVREGPFKAEWESLKAHEAAPEWFRDAKLGIYFHWGVYTVPAYGNEWYAKRMHEKTGRRSYYRHHVETWGEPDKFGYHDFIPLFKAEKFDAEQWAELFRKAGARYAGPVCEHHDGYSMWDSDMTPWNAADTGPKRDITGELAAAIRKRGMKFVTTFHHERTRTWYPRVEGWPTTSSDPKLQLLYMNIDEELFYRIFLAKLGEVVDKYRPDLMWFDGQMTQVPEQYHLLYLAYYFNSARRWGRDVVVTTKKKQYPPEVSVEDFEKGRMDRLTDYCWLTDDTISTGSWCYTKTLKVKPLREVLHVLIDIVSKNGCLLLNISPKSDGTIPPDQQAVLLGLGRWLEVNGEAIYATRPWLTFGEGPTRLGKGGGFVGRVEYTAKDIRYTRSKDGKALYAIALGWPEGGSLTLTAVRVDDPAGGRVRLLGCDKPLAFRLNADRQPVISVPPLKPSERPCRDAFVFELRGFRTSLHPKAALAPPAAARPAGRPAVSKQARLSEDLDLDAAEAGLAGPLVRLEQKIPGETNIGRWSRPTAKAFWRVRVAKPGKYELLATVATRAASTVVVEISGRTVRADVPATGDWTKKQTIRLGEVSVEKAGVHEVVLRPAEPAKWKAVNVWRLQLRAVGR